MTIQVNLAGQIRTKVGQEAVVLETESGGSAKLGEVLDHIAIEHPAACELLLTEAGLIAGGLLVLIENAAVVATRELAIEDGSTLTLLSAISGG